ncbi:hypothetical protein Q7C_235 [Methylophaga frappieri]|uniref:Uncharacterized protein n=1 Tax=Methylophaga frappieri (strain ATCC BAA-2434 / DSM 25690 / JAM7) TaxID=754477 RepID=I1YES1_METFJ|nr:RNA-binding S4 domain-containing protein [Methylophaga frappieri]AFJ01414.1 hypothetical protein Q7C_235 [Methylophaga frappieri]
MALEKITVHIHSSPVELYKVLKFEGLVSSGAEAKLVISDGQVTVNGTTETRKRRKLVAGDQIQFAEYLLTLIMD